MAVTVGEVCAEVHNYFVDAKDIHSENFTISGGVITPSDFLQPDQYFRIEHSVFNDGVWQNKASVLANLKPETFVGYIWAMRIPPDFLAICKYISDWDDEYGGVKSSNMSPYQSESYAGQYSYSKGYGGNNVSTVGTGWQSVDAIKKMLNKYRKVVGAR